MKRAIGIFLTLSSVLTYLIVDKLYDPIKETETRKFSGATTVTVHYQYPLMFWVICVILIITFILGIYFILAKEKLYEECPLWDTPEYISNK
ncbi:hypothetical protein [Bacillus sp. mrc49]|uniref:hypothetical protein n=1 Tax=Bacillus sp. mrc49 TaxID=2054913 RepID=UPI000C27359E|nr:hypothetical protein [Bacillus sp. mrc49]PJN90665.1 hypothetical protein CVN76_09070 [Bacillus sp. mrc49]